MDKKYYLNYFIYPLFAMVILFASPFCYSWEEYTKNYKLMEESLAGVGGGDQLIEQDYSNTNSTKQIAGMLERHSVAKYIGQDQGWVFDDILPPVFSIENSYIRSEKGYRYFNAFILRKLGTPLSNEQITNGKRGRWEHTNGTDWVSKYDFRVQAGHDGIIRIGYSRVFGDYVWILWQDEKSIKGKKQTVKRGLKYSHLSTISVDDGGEVKAGQVLGIMGETGRAFGVHLDFEVWENGKCYNPFSVTTYEKIVEL